MSLTSQLAPVTFTQGLDTHAQRKLVVPGKWDSLVNVSLSQDGSLKRRDGFAALLDGQAGNGLATHDNELLVVNGPDVSTVSEVGTNVAKQVPGQLPYVDIDRTEVLFDSANRDQQDMAYGDGYACYVWRGYNAGGGTVSGIYCSVVDLSSGAKLINGEAILNVTTPITTGISPRVVFANNAFFIFIVDTPNIFCAVIATSAPSTLGATAIVALDANITAAKNIDACAVGVQAYVAYVYNDATTSVRAISVTRSGTTPSVAAGPLNVVTEAAVTNASIHALAICMYAAATHAGVFLVHTAGGALAGGLVGAVIVDATFAVSTAAALLDNTVPPVASATHCCAVAIGTGIQTFFDQQSSYLSVNLRPLRSGTWSVTLTTVVGAYTLISSATFDVNAARASGPQGPFIAGKPFSSGGVAHLPVAMLENYNRLSFSANCDSTSAQCSFFVLRCETPSSAGTKGIVVAGALYGALGLFDPTLGGAAPTISTPPSSPALDSGFGICLQERGRLQISNGFNTTPVGLSMIRMTPRTTTPPLRTQLGESTYFAGGQVGNYDGRQIVQHGFPMFPEGVSAVRVATGGAAGKLTVGVHNVVVVYEWTDGAGNRHQSAASLPIEVTVSVDSDTISVIVPTTQLPQSAGYDSTIGTLQIVCYMTKASGVTYYRAITSYTPVVNDPTASTITLAIGTILMPDSTLETNEALYQQPAQAGTTLPNFPPGPLHGIGVSQKRLWGFLSDESFEFTYSQEPLPNTGLQFNPDSLGGSVPSTTGKGVAIAELDEKTILFCERGLYVVYGNGPTPSGGFNNFSEPQPIPSAVGCAEARSIIAIPAGLMFKSDKGWYLLGRDLSVRFIGEGVARWDSYDVTSAVMMEDRQEVRFSSSDEEAPVLVYSYEVGQWSAFAMGNLLHPGSVVDAVWWPATGRYVHLQPSTGVFPGLMQDTPDTYVDGSGTATPLQAYVYARTGWLHVAALEGFQRVRRLYLTTTAAAAPTTDLVISVDFDDMYDLDADGAYSVTVDLSTITFDNVAAIDLRHHLARQKCKSVAFTFLEGGGSESTLVPLTGLQVMSLEVGTKRGVNKLPAAQTVG